MSSDYHDMISATCYISSKVRVYVRKELIYKAQIVPPHDDKQHVCDSVRSISLSYATQPTFKHQVIYTAKGLNLF